MTETKSLTPAREKPCWVLLDPYGAPYDNGDAEPHYVNEAATEAMNKVLGVRYRPVEREAVCLYVSCDCCEYTFDEDEDGLVHFEDVREIMLALPQFGWATLGEGVFRCPTCVKGPCNEEAGDHG